MLVYPNESCRHLHPRNNALNQYARSSQIPHGEFGAYICGAFRGCQQPAPCLATRLQGKVPGHFAVRNLLLGSNTLQRLHASRHALCESCPLRNRGKFVTHRGFHLTEQAFHDKPESVTFSSARI